VPPHVDHLIPEELKEPLMRIHHASLSVWFYNTEVYDESPITNIWDLTTEEWRGNVVLPDIVLLTEYIATFGSIVENADEMAQAYQRRFGEEITLSPGIENAGWEWIYRVLRNDPLIVRTTHEVTEVVGEPGQSDPSVGLSAFSRLRDLERWPEQRFGVAWEMADPVFGFLHTNVHGFVRFGPNPNAAKLFLQFQLGDDYDFTGNKPYQVLGNWLVRADAPLPEGAPPLAELDYWDFDVEWIWDHYVQIVDFWTIHRP
jgi:iron(III) transport system substrate-binding protein